MTDGMDNDPVVAGEYISADDPADINEVAVDGEEDQNADDIEDIDDIDEAADLGVEPIEPIEPFNPDEYIEQVQQTDHAEPDMILDQVEIDRHVENAGLTGLAGLTQTAESAEPVEPAQPTQPAEPDMILDQAEIDRHVENAGLAGLTEPAGLTGLAEPVELAQTSEPAQSIQPDETIVAAETGVPVETAQADQPDQPDQSGESGEQTPGMLKKIFGRLSFMRKLFTFKRVALTAAVVVFFSAIGFLGVKIYTSIDDAEQDTNTYQASSDLYSLEMMLERKNERAVSAAIEAAAAENVQKQEPEALDSKERVSILDTLYPIPNTDDNILLYGSGNYNNYIRYMASRMSLDAGQSATPGVPLQEDPRADEATVDIGGQDVQYEAVNTYATDQMYTDWTNAQAISPAADIARNNPTVPAQEPFPLNVRLFSTVDDVLISGKLDLTNNTEFSVVNAFFEITLTYMINGSAEKEICYAYIENLFLDPGGEKTVTFAAIPPIKGNTSFAPDSIELVAFDTYIDEEPYKIYFDSDHSYLEVLAVGVY